MAHQPGPKYTREKDSPWIRIEEGCEYPKEWEVVIVNGGPAMYRKGKWYSGAEEPYYRRELQWEVDRYRRFDSWPLPPPPTD